MQHHIHNNMINDDGFEVCILCGVCTTLQHYIDNQEETDYKQLLENKQSLPYKYVLQNNNIRYIEDIEEAYTLLKRIMKHGTPNINIYAYCVYCVLIENKTYLSLKHIAHIFKVNDFPNSYKLI